MKNIRIGTCSWKYPSWQGIVYSSENDINYLSEYAQKYNTVEIDQWFWSLFGEKKVVLPQQAVAREYAQSVGDDFLFTIKVPNSITLTHEYNKKKSDPLRQNPHFLSAELFEGFLAGIAPLKDKTGLLMFQFEYLNKKKMASQSEFLDLLKAFIKKLPKDYSYGIEIRNPNYLNDGYFKFLQSEHCAHVFLQGYYMPDIFSLYNRFKDYIHDTVVIRLHGPGREDMEKNTGKVWNRIVASKDEEITSLIDILKDLEKRHVNVFVNVNNHYEGSAPLTIKKIFDGL
ncbi:MAG: DUF72 domain-containing protein [Spirochaetales bacterium]|nr:DUF72 domain-containing protein [Spirochaetales bacterium]